jgi:hypothetical protein
MHTRQIKQTQSITICHIEEGF